MLKPSVHTMQVFFDDQIFHRQKIGGVSRYICNLAEALAKTGRIKVTLFGGWSQNVLLKELAPNPNLHVIHFLRRDKRKVKSLAIRLSALWRHRVLKQALKWDSNIIYHPTYFELDYFLHQEACATVVTFHDMIAEIIFTRKSRREKRHRDQKLEAAQKAHQLIAISHSTKKDMHQFYPFTKEKINVVYHGSSLSYPENTHPLSVSLHPQRYFLFIGNRRGYKNGLAVLHAFALLTKDFPELNLLFCGGEVGPSNKERPLIKQYQIANRVCYVSADDSTLIKYLRNAIALIYPSVYEGFGLPVLEAMQNGCPVITTQLSSLPEVAGQAGIYIDPHSPEDIATAMKRMLTQSDERKKYIKDGFCQAQKFSLAKTAKDTLAVYKKAFESTQKRVST